MVTILSINYFVFQSKIAALLLAYKSPKAWDSTIMFIFVVA